MNQPLAGLAERANGPEVSPPDARHDADETLNIRSSLAFFALHLLPFLAILTRRTRLRLGEIGLLRIVAGLLLYAVLFYAHPLITGRPAMLP